MSNRKGQQRRKRDYHLGTQREARRVRVFLGVCADCGKRKFASKAAAKSNAQEANPHLTPHVYKCGEFWHFTSMNHVQNAQIRTMQAVGYEGPPLTSTDWRGYEEGFDCE